MQNSKWNKFKNGYARLIILTVLSIGAGLCMLIAPERVSDLVIRGVGLLWVLEGIGYAIQIRLKYLMDKNKKS